MKIEDTLEQALKIMKRDLGRLDAIREPLDRTESDKLCNYTKVLIQAAKHDRDAAKNSKLNEIPDDELKQLAEQALSSLKQETEDGNR